jgi:hypothetical protein
VETIAKENIMTRVSILFVVSTTLAALALSVGSAGAIQVDVKPQVHPTVTSAKPPPNQPKRQNTDQFKPKNPIVRY